MKQTAVEWLYNYLFPKQLDGFSDEEWNKIDEAFEQAKAMEKNHKTQIIKDYFEWHKSKGFVSHKITDIEDFCNETLKSE